MMILSLYFFWVTVDTRPPILSDYYSWQTSISWPLRLLPLYPLLILLLSTRLMLCNGLDNDIALDRNAITGGSDVTLPLRLVVFPMSSQFIHDPGVFSHLLALVRDAQPSHVNGFLFATIDVVLSILPLQRSTDVARPSLARRLLCLRSKLMQHQTSPPYTTDF